MSKLFGETRKAQNAGETMGPPRLTKVQQLLGEIRTVEKTGSAQPDSRLRRCRTVSLAPSPAFPFLFHTHHFTAAAMESYRVVRTRLLRLQKAKGLRSVVISSAVKDEGKTLTSINLALCSAQVPKLRTLLVDADLRSRGMTQQLGLPATPGLAEILDGKVQFEEALVSTNAPKLHILGAGKVRLSPAELFVNDRWKEFLEWCHECFDLILVDSPPVLTLTDFELIASGCDGIMIVVRALRTQREELAKVASRVDTSKLIGVVLNDTDEKYHSYYYY